MAQLLLREKLVIMTMILDKSDLPTWFKYPPEFLLLVEQKLFDFDPWIILTEDKLKTRFVGVSRRYPNRDLIPFARREDNDDLACFEKGKKVVIIHDFASPGFEKGENSIEFWDWFRMIVEDMIEYNSP